MQAGRGAIARRLMGSARTLDARNSCESPLPAPAAPSFNLKPSTSTQIHRLQKLVVRLRAAHAVGEQFHRFHGAHVVEDPA